MKKLFIISVILALISCQKEIIEPKVITSYVIKNSCPYTLYRISTVYTTPCFEGDTKDTLFMVHQSNFNDFTLKPGQVSPEIYQYFSSVNIEFAKDSVRYNYYRYDSAANSYLNEYRYIYNMYETVDSFKIPKYKRTTIVISENTKIIQKNE